MPTIEITQEQADALANGENVTLAPPPPPRSEKRHIVISSTDGLVYETRGPLNDADWRVLRGYGKEGKSNFPNWSPPSQRFDFITEIYKNRYLPAIELKGV